MFVSTFVPKSNTNADGWTTRNKTRASFPCHRRTGQVKVVPGQAQGAACLQPPAEVLGASGF